jgi:hypothetical protein
MLFGFACGSRHTFTLQKRASAGKRRLRPARRLPGQAPSPQTHGGRSGKMPEIFIDPRNRTPELVVHSELANSPSVVLSFPQ